MKEPSNASRRIHRSPEQWQSLVDQFEQSGLSQRTFCQQNSLAYGTFARWRRRLLGSNANSDHQANPEFIELLKGPQHRDKTAWDVELQLGESITLRLRRHSC